MRIHTEVIKKLFDKYLSHQIEISYLKTLFDKTFNESKRCCMMRFLVLILQVGVIVLLK